jgi:hypothetical protein
MKQSTIEKLLATGSFGKIHLGNECKLPEHFMVQTIELTDTDQVTIDKFRSCLQKEINVSSLLCVHSIVVIYVMSTWVVFAWYN